MPHAQRQARQGFAYPQDVGAEKALIASALLSAEVMPLVQDKLHDVDFFLEKHRLIWGRLAAMQEAGHALDIVTLGDALGADLDAVGGLAYLSSLLDNAPLATHAEDYARIVREKAMRRRLIEVGGAIQEKGLEGEGDLAELVDSAEQALLDVSQHQATKSLRSIRSIVPSSFAALEDLWANKGRLSGISSGFVGLDHLLRGFHAGELLILAARPAMGKTAFALNLLAQAGLREGKASAFFSLEMTAEQLGMRLLCAEARVDSGQVERGDIGEAEWARLARAAERIHAAPIYIDDQAALSVLDLRARCRRLKAREGLDLVIVDYLQLMTGAGQKSRELEIAYISRSLKGLAKDLGIPVIALSQLNRSLESRANKRPMMSDLRESGAIEQDADVIMFIYREAVYANSPDLEGAVVDPRAAEVIVAKQRNGPIGTAHLAFLGQFTRFENLAEDFYGLGEGR